METITYGERNMMEDLVADLDRKGFITLVLAVSKTSHIQIGSGLGELFLQKRPDIFVDFLHFANENLKGMVFMDHQIPHGNPDETPDDNPEEIPDENLDEIPDENLDENLDEISDEGTPYVEEDEEMDADDSESNSQPNFEEVVIKQEPSSFSDDTYGEDHSKVNSSEDVETPPMSAEDIVKSINIESLPVVNGVPVKADIEFVKIDSNYTPAKKFDVDNTKAKEVKFSSKVEIITLDEKLALRNKGLFRCDKCDKHFEFEHLLKAHKNRKMSCIDETFFRCEGVEKEIISYKDKKGTLKVMTAATALKILKKECVLCPYTNKRPSNVKRHFFAHHCNTKPFKCEFCEERFKMEYHLNSHLMMIHAYSDFEPFKCGRCGKELASQKCLKSHARFKCSERDRNKECKFCDFKAKSTTQLHEHEMTHTGEKPINCPFCDKAFHTERNLKSHLETHSKEKKHICTECGQTFRTRRQRYIHMKAHSRIKTVQECKVCGKTLEHATALKNHMYTHSDVKPYVCEFCGEGFIVKGRLVAHVKLHNGASQFQCEVCNKSFPKHSALRTHSLIHGERGYTCDRCGKSYHRRGQLTQHYKKHDVEMHVCDICDAKFGVEADLDKHVKEEHFDTSDSAVTDAFIQAVVNSDAYQ